MEYRINDRIIIDNAEEVVSRVQELSGCIEVNLDEIRKFINEENSTCFYFDNKMNGKSENDKGTIYLWVDTGYVSKSGRAIFISLLKKEGWEPVFVGSWVGDYYRLFASACKHFPGNLRMIAENRKRFPEKYERKMEKRKAPHLVGSDSISAEIENIECGEKDAGLAKTLNAQVRYGRTSYTSADEPNVATEIYDNLLVPNWNSVRGLERYLKIIGTRLRQLINRGCEQYYVLNNYKDAIVNTGIMDPFGNDYLVMYRINQNDKFAVYGNYQCKKIIRSKADYLSNGFSKDQAIRTIHPINFIDEGIREFMPTMEDFDLDTKDLFHIIEERRARFPENLASLSNMEITNKLRAELEMGIKMQMHDSSYAKLHYSAKYGKAVWLLPFHVNTSIIDRPELVMVVVKQGEFYRIKTILTYDDFLEDKLTALSLYSHTW